MKCPTCQGVDLVMTDRQGVEIDYCPKCRGVWLDRGELDKIIERSERYDERRESKDERREYREEAPPRSREYHERPYRRKSFWSELFD